MPFGVAAVGAPPAPAARRAAPVIIDDVVGGAVRANLIADGVAGVAMGDLVPAAVAPGLGGRPEQQLDVHQPAGVHRVLQRDAVHESRSGVPGGDRSDAQLGPEAARVRGRAPEREAEERGIARQAVRLPERDHLVADVRAVIPRHLAPQTQRLALRPPFPVRPPGQLVQRPQHGREETRAPVGGVHHPVLLLAEQHRFGIGVVLRLLQVGKPTVQVLGLALGKGNRLFQLRHQRRRGPRGRHPVTDRRDLPGRRRARCGAASQRQPHAHHSPSATIPQSAKLYHSGSGFEAYW